METKKTKKAPVKPVKKPYLTGRILDAGCIKTAVFLVLAVLGMALANLLLTAALNWDSAALRVLCNGVVVVVIYLLFYQSGANKGAGDVNQGEILYQRRETCRTVDAKDLARCFHPLKGFATGLIGALPVVLAALVLALTAQRQMTSIGALPNWITGLERRDEVGAALSFYNQTTPLTVTDGLHVFVRMVLMPFVNMIGTRNMDGILLLERISPLMMLLPGLMYGLGYLQGVRIRTSVHTDIALGKRKRARKEKKRRQARVRQAKGPEQLN